MKTEEKLLIQGEHGNIELAHSPGEEKGLFVMCHPHPLYQGSMNNKVVTTAIKAFHEMGYSTVRFNYRGVGKSEGSYGEGLGEAQDCERVARWAQEIYSGDLILGGFSFGCFVAYFNANPLQAKKLLLIAPAVDRLDFSQAEEPQMPCYVIQGTADEVVDPESTYQFVQNAKNPPELTKLEGVGHFFHHRLGDLKDLITGHYA